MIDTVETDLVNAFGEWETLEIPTNDQFVNVILDWAWAHGYRTTSARFIGLELGAMLTAFEILFSIVRRWLAGDSYAEIAGASGTDLNEVLAIHTGAISYALQSVVEQGVSLLEKLLESQGRHSLQLYTRFRTILGSEFRRLQHVRSVRSAFVIAAPQFCWEASPRYRRLLEMGELGCSKAVAAACRRRTRMARTARCVDV